MDPVPESDEQGMQSEPKDEGTHGGGIPKPKRGVKEPPPESDDD